MNNKLIQSYVKDKFFVSTIYRESSACVPSPPWYFETMVWAWDKETRQRGELLEQYESGYTEVAALASHFCICKEYAEKSGKLQETS